MSNFETSVRVRRPIDEVFAYVANPLNLPEWNSAVEAVSDTDGSEGEVGRTYSMTRRLPSGRVQNGLEVFAREPPIAFSIRTTSGPTPFTYRYRFSSENEETVVRLAAEFELGGAAALLGPFAARAVKRGVDENLAVLKRNLETAGPP